MHSKNVETRQNPRPRRTAGANAPFIRGRFRAVVFTVCSGAGLLCSYEARAQTPLYWKDAVTTGNFSGAANWSANSPAGTDNAGPPGANNNALIQNTLNQNYLITLDNSFTVSQLIMGDSGGGLDTLSLSSNYTLTLTNGFFDGFQGAGAFTQSAGTVSVTGFALFVGGNSGDVGTFTQSGGTVTDPSSIVGASGSGTYQLSGTASLTDTAGQILGQSAGSHGTFIQTGGSHVIGTSSASTYLNIAQSSGANGTYALSGTGSLMVYGSAYVGGSSSGVGGAGTLSISGGSMSVSNTLQIDSTGVLNLSGGSLTAGGDADGGSVNMTGGSLNSNGPENVGYLGGGTFTQSGGVHTVGLALYPAQLAIGQTPGTYNLSGTGSLIVYGSTYVGGTSSGAGTGNSTLAISGGAMSVSNTLQIYPTGNAILSGGTLTTGTLSQNGGLLNSAINETVGTGQEFGTVTQSGGSNVVGTAGVTANLDIGPAASAPGTYTLSGTGSATINGSVYVGAVDVGVVGAGTLNINGGTISVSNALQILSGGILNFTSGSLSTGAESIGLRGSATVVQSGGFHNVAGTGLTLSAETGLDVGDVLGMGTYALSGGTLQCSGLEAVGVDGRGYFTQTGGLNQVGSSGITIGIDDGNGTYNLSGSGSLLVNGDETVGAFNTGFGTLNESGGVNIVGSLASPTRLFVGYGEDSEGTINLSGTASLTVNGSAYIGGDDSGSVFGAAGTLAISGGALSISNTLQIYSTGTFILSGGSVSAGTLNQIGGLLTSSTNETVGTGAEFGTVNQTGGTNIVGTSSKSEELDIAPTASAPGTYTLSGTGSATINGSTYVGGTSKGAGGSGTLAISSGSMSVSNGLEIYSTGTLNLSGGMLSLVTLLDSGSLSVSGGTLGGISSSQSSVQIFSGGTVTQTAGAIAFSGGTLSLDNAGTFNLSGTGSFAVNNAAIGGIVINSTPSGAGTLAISGGSMTVGGTLQVYSTGTLNLSGGMLSVVTLLDSGSLSVSGGTLSGNSSSQSSVQIFSGGTVTQTAGMIAFSGGTLSLDNAGTFNLSGTGSFAVNNAAIGGITVNSSASGAGTLAISGGSMTVGSTLQVYSTGTLNLSGGTLSAVTVLDSGRLSVSGGTLSGISSSQSSVQIFSGGTVTQTAGAIAFSGGTLSLDNAGTFNLSGTGSFAVNNAAIGGIVINSTPSGAGTLAISGGSMTVGGTLKVYSTGTLTLTGSNNLTADTLDVSSAAKFAFSGGSVTVNFGNFLAQTSGSTIGDGTQAATLLLNRATVSNGGLTIQNNAALAGSGSLTTGVTVNAGGTLAPSKLNGVLLSSANLTLSTTGSTHSIAQFEIGAATTPGITYDQLSMTGSGATFTVGGATLQLIPVPGVIIGTTYPIVIASSGATINYSAVFSNLTAVPATSNYLYSSGGTTADVTYSNSAIDVTFLTAQTPEPTSVALLGFAALLLRRRPRRAVRLA